MKCGTKIAGKINNTDEANKGFTERQRYIKESREVEMIGHLHGDIFNQEKFLINGVDMCVKLVRSRESFNLMASTNDVKVKVSITEATLMVRKERINPSVLLAHQKVLASTTAKYPITKAEVKVLTIPTGVQGKTLDIVFLGQIPKRCIIGFVSYTAFNGSFMKNPYDFDNFGINSFSLYIDGMQVQTKTLQLSFSTGLHVAMLHTLFSGTGIHFLNKGNGINRDRFAKGYCLMAFDLTPDLSANSSSHWNLIKQGSVRLEVRFDNALSQTINCIVYAEFDNLIEIDRNRNVTVDFGS